MDFKDFSDKLKVRLAQPLPGAAAHEAMRSVPTGAVRPVFENRTSPKPGAVLILLYPQAGTIMLPLTKRADYNGAHSGQISLPGGKREAGETAIENALRESEEEIGIPKTAPVVLGTLTEFFVIPSNFLVTPVVAVLPEQPIFARDSREVVRIIELDALALASDASPQRKEILAAGRFAMDAPYFDAAGEIVWGATAMMLNEFRLVVQSILKK